MEHFDRMVGWFVDCLDLGGERCCWKDFIGRVETLMSLLQDRKGVCDLLPDSDREMHQIRF